MPWHARPSAASAEVPGGEIGDPYPAFSRSPLPGPWAGTLYRRNSPGYAGTLYFTDPFTQILNGNAYSQWRVRPVSYDLIPSRMEWTRCYTTFEESLHQTDGLSILHSVLLPSGVVGANLARCRVPDGFVFAVDTDGDVVAGIYFMPIAQLTGAPALGNGNQPTVVQKHVFVNQNGCRGGVLVGDTYYFIEPMAGFYPGNEPKYRFSNYDLGSSTYTAGLEMPAGRYYGISYVTATQEIATPRFLVLMANGEGLQQGLYIYDAGLNTITLAVRAPNIFVGYGSGLGLATEASVNFPLVLHQIDSFGFPYGSVTIENANGIATTLTGFAGELLVGTSFASLTCHVIDPDYDYVTWHLEWSDDAGFSWNPATLISGPDYPEAPSQPVPGFEVGFIWDTAEAAPAAEVDLRFVLDTPAWDSAGVFAQIHLVIIPTIVPPVNVLTDKLNAANLEFPLIVEEASAGTVSEAGKEMDLVLVGKGFRVLDEMGDPRVRAVFIKSVKASQVFDYTRFRLVSAGEQDILNLRLVVPTAGTYDIFLLDRDGARIAAFPAGLKVG